MYGVSNALKRAPISNTGQPRWILSYLSWALWDHFEKVTFSLYIEALDSLLPWFFVLDHPHYSRWLPVHRRDMRILHSAYPAVAEEFENGKFVVKKTHRLFSSIALDHAHEQNNSIVKGDGGAIGLTENSSQLMKWMAAGLEMARVFGEFEDSVQSLKQKQIQELDVKNQGSRMAGSRAGQVKYKLHLPNKWKPFVIP